MIQINQIECPIDTDLTLLKPYIAKKCHIQENDILEYTIIRKSIDAREKLCLKITALVETPLEKKLLAKHNRDITKSEKTKRINFSCSDPKDRPIIVGCGPAGLFAAYALAEAGCKPIILERGKQVEQRVKDIEFFWQTGILDPKSNVQYGEGGAGTFSDGKLTCRLKDPNTQTILEILVEAGADPEILIMQHPHIGTDVLRNIIINIRKKIESMGANFYFEHQVDQCIIENNQIVGVIANNQRFDSKHIIFAIGHSATDTIMMLDQNNVEMKAKDFAVGVRIEHPQKWVNERQYKQFAGHPALKNAEYRLTHTTSKDRGVYTFCMCPGGSVVAAASSNGQLVINGMSESKRNLDNANSAILVQVKTSDLKPGLFAGLDYIQSLEKKAFLLAHNSYKAPAEWAYDYLKINKGPFDFSTSYLLGNTMCDLHDLFDPFINEALEEALLAFDKKMPGFKYGLMTAVESRSSSPIQILRNEKCISTTIEGLYPCGEGAGYAGGIMSAALDGFRCALAILEKFS